MGMALASGYKSRPPLRAANMAASQTRSRSGSDVLPFGRVWYDRPNAVENAIGYAEFYRRSHEAVIRAHRCCNLIETHEHAGEFKEP